jgi:hypothetical protein
VLGRPVINGLLNAIIVGTGVGFFEEFYVQSRRGRWLRSMHPLKSILIYALVVVALFLLSIILIRLILWDWNSLPWIYRHFPIVLPIMITFSVVGIVVMRVAHFIGVETLFHLTIGTYHRPVVEKKVLMFLDINDSTLPWLRASPLGCKAVVRFRDSCPRCANFRLMHRGRQPSASVVC